MSEWWNTFKDGFKNSELLLLHPWPIWLVAPLLIGCVVLVIYLYNKERRMLPWFSGISLLVIRIILILLVLMMLLEPVISTSYEKPVRGVVLVLVDKSLSMSVPSELNSEGNRLMLAEALGLLKEGKRKRGPESLSQTADTAVRIYEDEFRKAFGEYRAALTSKSDLQARYRQEVEAAARKYVERINKLLADSGAALAGMDNVAPDLMGPLRVSIEKLNKQKAELTAWADKLNSPPTTPGTTQPPVTAGADALRRLFDAAREPLNEVKALADAVQRKADEDLAKSADPDVKKAMAEVNKMSRFDQVKVMLAKANIGGQKLSLLERLYEIHDLRFATFDSEVQLRTIPANATPEDAGKLLGEPDVASTAGDTLQRAVDAAKGDAQLAGVVLIGDGQYNKTETAPLDYAQRVRFPIHTVGIGDTEPPRDVITTKVEGTETVFKTDKAILNVAFVASGFQERDLPVKVEKVERDGSTIPLDGAETIVRLKPQEKTGVAKLTFTPNWDGEAIVRVGIPVQEGEFIKDNNWREIRINVVKDKLKVLLIDRDPRWEYIFLKKELERDKFVQLNSILLSTLRQGQEMPRGEQAGQFPANRAQLDKYKMVIIGDLSPSSFTPTDLENFKSYVSNNGGVLVIISGKAYMPAAYANIEAMTDLLPVRPYEYPEGYKLPGSFIEPYRIRLTAEGKDESFLSLKADPIANAEAWANLLPIYWFAPVYDVKPAATVLVQVVPTAGRGEQQQGGPVKEGGKGDQKDAFNKFKDHNLGPGVPLIATQSVGLGKVLWLGTDSTWRWRYKVDREYFARFWGQILRWSTTGHLTGRDTLTRFGPRKGDYDENESIIIECIHMQYDQQKDIVPYNMGSVTAQIFRGTDPRDPDAKQVAEVPLKYVDNSGGLYRGTLAEGLKGGEYHIRIRSTPSNVMAQTERGYAPIRVAKNLSGELYNVMLNEKLLQQISEKSGGKYYTVSTARDLPEEFERNPHKERVHTEIEAWNHWAFMVLFFIFLSLEWAVRKWKGLV
jgi:hypothetical protein